MHFIRAVAYGSLPLYLQKLWIAAAESVHLSDGSFVGGILAARVLSVCVGVAMVYGVYVLGRRLYSREAGLTAAALLALAVLPIQHAHFITFDQACNPDFSSDTTKSGPCTVPKEAAQQLKATGIPNPNYRKTINDPGHRFAVGSSNALDAWISATFMF